MKRAAESDPQTQAKRVRPDSQSVSDSQSQADLYAETFSQENEKRVSDVLQNGTDGTGHLRCQVIMRWPANSNKLPVLLEIRDGFVTRQRVNVNFTGRCCPHFAALNFTLRTDILLALKGAFVISGEVPAPSIKFEDGCLVKFLESTTPGQVDRIVDTWELTKEMQSKSRPIDQADWFSTPSSTEFLGQSVGAVVRELPDSDGAGIHTSPDLGKPTASHPSNEMLPTSDPANTASLDNISQHLAGHSSNQNLRNVTEPRSAESRGATSIAQEKKRAKAKARKSKHLADDNTETAQDGPPTSIVTNQSPSGDPSNRTTHDSASPTEHEPSKKERKRLAKVQKKRLSRASLEQQQDGSASVPDSCSTNTADDVNQVTAEALTTGPSACSLVQSVVSVKDSANDRLRPDKTSVDDVAIPDAGKHSVVPPSHGRSSVPVQSNPLVHQAPSATSRSSSRMSSPVKLEYGKEIDSLQAPFHTEAGRYTPLMQVVKGKTYNLMGVVVSVGGITNTSTNEFKVKFDLVDPSTGESDGFSVMCFARSKDALPTPQTGDILMFRHIQGDAWLSKPCATAPSYKGWTWAVYGPNDSGSGAIDSTAFPPCAMMFQPSKPELDGCKRLSDWWKEIASHRITIDLGTVHQIEGSSMGPGNKRTHRLISEASPTVEPNGFFDCTVEVLYGHPNDNGIYSLYVTDYTRNKGLTPVQRSWCPPELADKVLKLELFLKASEQGPKMAPGSYWFLGNCRMKVSAGGYVEGSFSEVQKMRPLDEDELEDQPHLEALLRRKQEWEAKVKAGGVEEFPHKLFSEVEVDCHFRCTVQVLHVSPKDDCTYMYVTDYTERHDLVPVAPTVAPMGLHSRVIKIAMYDAQAETAKNLEPGDYITIRNLRLKTFVSNKKIFGRLGSDQRLINKLQPNGNSEELKELLRRKTQWDVDSKPVGGRKRRTKKPVSEDQKPLSRTSAIERAFGKPMSNLRTYCNAGYHESTDFKAIREVKASDVCPGRFHIRARIVDFFPKKLEDVTVRRCTSCGDQISDNMRVCPKCDDAMDPDDYTFVRTFYQLFLEVEDEEGSTLKISVCDDQCNLFKGLEMIYFRDDPDNFHDFVNRMWPFVGNLLEVKDGVVQRQLDTVCTPDTPTVPMTIANWRLEDESNPDARGYVLMRIGSLMS